MNDPRYKSLSFKTNEFDVQSENGVLPIIIYSPHSWYYIP